MTCVRTHPARAEAVVDGAVRPELHGDGEGELLGHGDQDLVQQLRTLCCVERFVGGEVQFGSFIINHQSSSAANHHTQKNVVPWAIGRSW